MLACLAGYAALIVAGCSDDIARQGADAGLSEAGVGIRYGELEGDLSLWLGRVIEFMRRPENVAAVRGLAERLLTDRTLSGDEADLIISCIDEARTSSRRFASIDGLPGTRRRTRQLVLCNTQSELHPLEEGKHAAESGMDLKAHAEEAGKRYDALHQRVRSWRVLHVSNADTAMLRDSWRNLAEIHAAPEWLWGALVERMLALCCARCG